MTKIIAFALVVIAVNLTISNLALLFTPAQAADSLAVKIERNVSHEGCGGSGYPRCGMPVYVVNFPTR